MVTSFCAAARLLTPMSMKRSSIFGAFGSFSAFIKCGATLPTTPFTGPFFV
jgi:hypothetical protein